MTIIKKVAAAIQKEFSGVVHPHYTRWDVVARAAIEAMREPTEEMKQAAARGVSDSFHEEGFQEGDDPSLWKKYRKTKPSPRALREVS